MKWPGSLRFGERGEEASSPAEKRLLDLIPGDVGSKPILAAK